MPTFRVHLSDGRKVDVEAKTPEEARAKVVGKVTKVKEVREKVDG